MTTGAPSHLTDEQVQTLIEKRIETGPATTDELERIVEWADNVALDASLYNMAVAGRIAVSWPDGAHEPIFKHVAAAA